MTKEEKIQYILSQIDNIDKLKLILKIVFQKNLPNLSEEQLTLMCAVLDGQTSQG